ncbi:MAG: tRNA (adenosine(37)-N6)-dimethylallyltransferase MiaA, partial [Candidatus Neomarinimicrobiota bacterium]|nr:tRNA (adenosine(37)-N6)-dimethylallyltransferase MiaA [Candidatus Neomarinimicrobiota bacterium]
YFKALFEGIFSESKTDLDIRKRLEKEYDIDKKVLYQKLQSIDPDYALKVHINNKKRLVRALELYETTGKNMSDNFLSENEKSDFHDRFFTVYLKMSRPILQERIVKRTNYMLKNGLIKEVENIIDKGYDVSQLDYIGFDEIASYLSGHINLDEASERIIIRTRQYAKRQLKWFDTQGFDIVIDADNINSDDIVDKIVQIY